MSKEPKIEVSRLYKLESDTKTKAFVDVVFEGVVIKGLRIVQGKNGLFVSMPRQQGKNGQWYNAIYPKSKEMQQKITEIVLAAYQA